jgi:hypothetical protein
METFLHDYGVLVAPTAAIINGFIAVLVAQFFKDHPVAKVLLVVSAGALGTAAIAATFYTQHQIVAAQKADAQRRQELRNTFGNFISEGLKLIADCGDNSKPPPWAQTNAWVEQLTAFLGNQIGPSYVERLKSPAGVPVNVTCRNADGPHSEHYHIVYSVLFRLDEFSHEAFN